jgi:hypothetical protein
MNMDFSYFHLNTVQIAVFDFVSWTLPVLKAECLQPGTFETILHIRRLYASYKTFKRCSQGFYSSMAAINIK